MWLNGVTEIDEVMTLPFNLEVHNAVIGMAAFIIVGLFMQRPFSGTALVLAYLFVSSQINGFGPPGWTLHILHYLQIGVRLNGFCRPKTLVYDVW